jgi:hypothetical protein
MTDKAFPDRRRFYLHHLGDPTIFSAEFDTLDEALASCRARLTKHPHEVLRVFERVPAGSPTGGCDMMEVDRDGTRDLLTGSRLS